MIHRLALLSTLMGAFVSSAEASNSPSALLEDVRGTSVKAGPMLPLTKEKFQLMTFAMELSIAVSWRSWDMGDGGPQGLYGDAATYYEDADDVDAVLTLDAGDYCFVAWRGTNFDNTRDALSNANIIPKAAVRLDGLGQCEVTSGAYGAYKSGPEIEPAFIQFVETCMAAGAPNKQLVLTGHSQGAGAAVVGAIRFAGYEPLTIPLAGPPIVRHPSNDCRAIDAEHVWRVTSTEIQDGKIIYDEIPYSNIAYHTSSLFLGEQIGASIHLPPDTPNPINEEDPYQSEITFTPDQYNVAYFSKDQILLEETYGPHEYDDFGMRNDINWGVHSMYELKMYKMLANADFPLDVSGYIPGTKCTGDEECQFECVRDVCVAEGAGLLPDGEACTEHDDCLSGSCSGCVMNFGGDWCCTGMDSGHGTTPNGSGCQVDGNCASDRCTWDYVCEDKLDDGAGCINDGDCKSGHCSWVWGCGPASARVAPSGASDVVQM